MEPSQARKIWEEIVSEARKYRGEKQPDEYTISEFSDLTGLALQTARDFLELRVRKGVLKKRKIYLPEAGTSVNLYSPTVCEEITTDRVTL